MRVVAAGLHVVHARADAVEDGAGHRAQRQREAVVGIRDGRLIGQRPGRAVDRLDRRAARAVHEGEVRPAGSRVGGHCLGGRPLLRRRRSAVRARERVRARVRDRRHAGLPRHERPRRLGRRVPRGQRIDRPGQRIEIASQPARSARRLRIRGAENVGGLEVRAARVLVARPLHDREAALVEDVRQAAEPRVKAERPARSIGAHLQHLACRHGNGGTPAVVALVLVRNQRVERVVAAAEIHDHQSPRRQALRLGDGAQERRRREAERDRGHTVADEKRREICIVTPATRAGIRPSRPTGAPGRQPVSRVAPGCRSTLRRRGGRTPAPARGDRDREARV